jgi:hypothetical protein
MIYHTKSGRHATHHFEWCDFGLCAFVQSSRHGVRTQLSWNRTEGVTGILYKCIVMAPVKNPTWLFRYTVYTSVLFIAPIKNSSWLLWRLPRFGNFGLFFSHHLRGPFFFGTNWSDSIAESKNNLLGPWMPRVCSPPLQIIIHPISMHLSIIHSKINHRGPFISSPCLLGCPTSVRAYHPSNSHGLWFLTFFWTVCYVAAM